MLPRPDGQLAIDDSPGVTVRGGLGRGEPGVEHQTRACIQRIGLSGVVGCMEGVQQGRGGHRAGRLQGMMGAGRKARGVTRISGIAI